MSGSAAPTAVAFGDSDAQLSIGLIQLRGALLDPMLSRAPAALPFFLSCAWLRVNSALRCANSLAATRACSALVSLSR